MTTPDPELPRFRYDPRHDTNDGAPWSETDIEDLRASIEHGGTLEKTASLLCRAGTPDDVARKAAELGLFWRPASTLPSGVDVIRWDTQGDTWGIRIVYPCNVETSRCVGTREEAEAEAEAEAESLRLAFTQLASILRP